MYRKRHFQLCGYLCLLCVWFHISCIWLPIHVSVRINFFFFFFFISQSNDQPTYKLYTIYTRTVLQCNNHFRSFFFWCFVVQNSRVLLLYLWNEMLWEHYVFFGCPQKPFGKCFYCSLSLYTFHSLIAVDIFYCSMSHSLSLTPTPPPPSFCSLSSFGLFQIVKMKTTRKLMKKKWNMNTNKNTNVLVLRMFLDVLSHSLAHTVTHTKTQGKWYLQQSRTGQFKIIQRAPATTAKAMPSADKLKNKSLV